MQLSRDKLGQMGIPIGLYWGDGRKKCIKLAVIHLESWNGPRGTRSPSFSVLQSEACLELMHGVQVRVSSLAQNR